MKKIVALLTAGVLLAVVSPMAIAADLNFNGEFKSEINYNLNQTAVDNWDGESRLELGASLGDKLQGGFSVTGLENAFVADSWINDSGYDSTLPIPNPVTESTNKIGLDHLWVQSTGALWNNGPELTTRIGSLNANYSAYVADVTDPGVSVEGTFGKVTVGAFNAWNTGNPGYGLHASVKPSEKTQIGATFTKVNNNSAYAIEGQVKPSEALTLDGAYAMDNGSEAHAYKAGANYQLTNTLGVHGSVRDFQPGFNPTWRSTDMYTDIEGDLKAEPTNPVADNYGEKGFILGATAQLAGFSVTADYNQFNQQDGDVDFRRVDTTIAREFNLGSSKLTASLVDKYDLETSENQDLDANLKYTAPNGLALEVNHDFESEETTAAAGLSMKF